MPTRILGILVFITLIASFSVLTSNSAYAADFKLTYSNFFPPTHIQSKLAELWCKEVEKRTNGRVVVQYFPGSTLTKSKQAYDGVVSGLSDVALSLFAYTRGRFPLMEAVDFVRVLPGKY